MSKIKSEAQKRLEGTTRKDRIKDEADFPVVDSVDELGRPDWLDGPEAVSKWDELTVLLVDAGVLTSADLSELAHYCNMHASHVKLWRAGMSPTASDTAQRRMLATEFGLTPASRSRPMKARDTAKKENRFDGLRAS